MLTRLLRLRTQSRQAPPRFPVHAHTHTCYPILRPRSLAHTFSALYYLTAPRHDARHLSSPTAAHPPTAAAQIFGRLAFCFTLRAPSSLSPFSSPHLAARRCTHSTRHARITPTYRPTSARCRPRCTPRWVCKIWRRCVSAAYRRFPIPPRLPPSFVPPRSLAYPNAPRNTFSLNHLYIGAQCKLHCALLQVVFRLRSESESAVIILLFWSASA